MSRRALLRPAAVEVVVATALLAGAGSAGCRFDGGGLGRTIRATADAVATDAPAHDQLVDAAPADLPDSGHDAAVETSIDLPPRPDLPDPTWWDPAWTRRRRLSFDNSGRDEDLAAFVVLVKLDSSRLDYAAGNKDGHDLRFVDADQATLLPHEVEHWEEGGTSLVWVRVPLIDRLSATDHIWLYSGYPQAKAPPASDAQTVWDDGAFAGVWHMCDDKDAVAGNDAKNHGASATDGQVGDGRYFDGADYVELPQSSSFDLDQLTLELWARSSQTWDAPYWPGSAVLVSRATQGWGSTDWSVIGGRQDSEIGDAGRVLVGVGVDTGTAWEPVLISAGQLNDDAFHYVVWSRTAGGDNALYIDGAVQAELADNGGSIVADRPIHVGGDALHPGAAFLVGTIDELRLSSVARSGGWISAQHASMTDVLITFGPEEIL